MATPSSQSDLVVQRIQDMADLATTATVEARRYLQDLATGVSWTGSALIDVNIGSDADISWDTTVAAPASPVEPDYSGEAPTAPTVDSVTTPAAIGVADRATWDADLTGAPSDMAAMALSSVPVLEALPEIAAVTPTIDVALLDADFAFTEPTYTERVSPTVKTELLRVLGGDLGIPQTVWDGMWSEVSGSVARQLVGRLRTARNRGAASYWALPSETVLAEANRISDESAMELQRARFEQAWRQAVMAREDFWQAISQGIAYEQQWIAAHQQMAGRALAAAEQLVGLKVQVHNLNIVRFNALLEAARIEGTLDDLKVQRILKKQAALLQANAMEIDQDKQVVTRYQAKYQGFQIATTAQITNLAEQVKRYSAEVDADARYQALRQAKSQLDVNVYTSQLGAIESVARATAAVLQARTGAATFDLQKQATVFQTDVEKNRAALEVARITQAAQEAAARLDISQAEWAEGQATSTKQRIAELAFGFAQAAFAGADVSLGSSVSVGEHHNVSASQNEEMLWTFSFN